MVEVAVAVGYVLAWVLRKTRRVAIRADGVVDSALDAAVDKVGELLMGKLGSDSAVQQLHTEATESGQVSDRTRTRVELTLADALDKDTAFAGQLAAAIAEADKARGSSAVAPGGVAISGGVNATGSGIALGAVTGGQVSINRARTDPHQPGRA